jgi:hypothetical protein
LSIAAILTSAIVFIHIEGEKRTRNASAIGDVDLCEVHTNKLLAVPFAGVPINWHLYVRCTYDHPVLVADEFFTCA